VNGLGASRLGYSRDFPLSPGQRSLLLARGEDTLGLVVELRRPKAGRLRRILEAPVERHAALRGILPRAGAMPAQRVVPHAAVDFATRDFLSKSVRLQEIDNEIGRSFDISRGPMVRFRLFTFPPQRVLLVIVAHPMVIDLPSVARLLEELGAALGAAIDDPEHRLPQIPDYVGAVKELWSRPEVLAQAHDSRGELLLGDRPRSRGESEAFRLSESSVCRSGRKALMPYVASTTRSSPAPTLKSSLRACFNSWTPSRINPMN